MAASSSAAAASARAEAGEESVIRAEDLAPSAFAAGDAASAAELAALGVKRPDDLEYDEANLSALDSHPVDATKLASSKKEKYLAVVAREGVQLLIRRIFALPYEATEDGPMAVLPRPRTHIPRRLPVPESRPETKWERFAKEKGIKKTKRSRMVLDDQTGEWAPRWGYKRANDDTKDWAIPVKGGEDGMSDPFKERELKKQERVLKNKVQNLKNRERAERNKGAARRALGAAASSAESMAAAAAAGTPVGIPRTMKASEGDVSGVTGQGRQKRPRPAGETKHDKTKKVRAAQVATASMGRFDRRLPGEPEAPRDPVRHKKRAATPSGPGEHSRDLAVLSSVVHGAGAGGAKMPGAGKRSAKSTGPGAAGARVFRKDKPRK